MRGLRPLLGIGACGPYTGTCYYVGAAPLHNAMQYVLLLVIGACGPYNTIRIGCCAPYTFSCTGPHGPVQQVTSSFTCNLHQVSCIGPPAWGAGPNIEC